MGLSDNPILGMYYNNLKIQPIPTMSYSSEIYYQNDTASGMKYNITLNGYIMASDFPGGVTEGIVILNNIFSSNHKTLQIDSLYQNGSYTTVFLANNILVKSIRFQETDNNWSKFAKYTIELESMNVIVGADIADNIVAMNRGDLNTPVYDNMSSLFMQDMSNHTLREWNEQFSIQTGDQQISRTTVVEKVFQEGVDKADTPISILTTLGGDQFTISYSISATGKQVFIDVDLNGAKETIPAWEHAKRFVHKKLLVQMGGLFNNFLSLNGAVPRELMGQQNPLGAFSAFQDFRSNGITTLPSYGLYNEHVSFDVSESNGSFSCTYNATVQRHCPTENTGGNVNDDYVVGCVNGVSHTLTKSVEQSYDANEKAPEGLLKTSSITVNGTITGMVPGGILGPKSRIIINNFTTGSFLTYNTTDFQFPETGLNGGYDRSFFANLAFDYIFDYYNYDLKPKFKEIIGVTPFALGVDTTAPLKPSSMNITRDLINGTVNYSATYTTQFNCDPNNFEITVSSSEKIPVIAEFVVPNNNIKDPNGVLCDNGKGYGVIQLLGTYTPKTLDIGIKAGAGSDFNKCCLGTSNNYNLLDYNFIQLESFIIPEGMNIPYIGEGYALTKKTRSMTYPQGEMSINLSYVCSDFCEIDTYFS